MPTRCQRKAVIAECIKHVLEELWEVEEDDVPHKIFTRESNKGRVDHMYPLAKYNLLTLSWQDDSGDVAHLSMVDEVRIIMILHFKTSLSHKGL